MSEENRPEEELDIEAINRAARAQVADEENRAKAKNWQIWVHGIAMLPVIIGLMINYGWFDWVMTFAAWVIIVPLVLCVLGLRQNRIRDCEIQ